jgi:hypothetical protein
MTGTNSDLFTHNQSRSYLNHLVYNEVGKERTRAESVKNIDTCVRKIFPVLSQASRHEHVWRSVDVAPCIFILYVR